mmetsp:Transcript_70701/g.153524  ORF Transcript_70701/g.153524 Transcript_70701/m.153524 type:complete len:1092 (+) Transcript_70701:54-3329(+)
MSPSLLQHLGVLQCARCDFRVTGFTDCCCSACGETHGASHDELCRRVPLLSPTPPPRLCSSPGALGRQQRSVDGDQALFSASTGSSQFEQRLLQLLTAKGPLRLCGVPGDYDDYHGQGAWKADRPVKAAKKACMPPYVNAAIIMEDWLHAVEEGSPLPPDKIADVEAECQRAADLCKEQRELLALEFNFLFTESSEVFSHTKGIWTCRLSCRAVREGSSEKETVEGAALEAEEDAPLEVSSFGFTSDEALLGARRDALRQEGSWCNAGDPLLDMLVEARRIVGRLLHEVEGIAKRGSQEDLEAPARLEHELNLLLRQLELVRGQPPNCRGCYWSFLAAAWSVALMVGEHSHVERITTLMVNTVPPLNLFIQLAETAAWYVDKPFLEYLEHIEIMAVTSAERYVHFQLYSLFLEQRAQLRKELEGLRSSGTFAEASWEASDGSWTCTLPDKALACYHGHAGATLLSEKGSKAISRGILCVVGTEGKMTTRAIPGLDLLASVVGASSVQVVPLPCYTTVQARQREVLKALPRPDFGPFDAKLASIIVRTWARRGDPPDAEAVARTKQAAALASEDPQEAKPPNLDEGSDISLSDSQQKAVNNLFTRRFSLVRGPPGTGKTHVAAAMARGALLRWGGERVLAATQSNAAAANLQKRLEFFGVKAARVGSTLRPKEVVEQQIFQELIAKEPDDPDLRALKAAAHWDTGADRTPSSSSSAMLPSVFTTILQRLAYKADVVVVTCATSGNRGLLRGLGPIQTLIMDEAAQCIEPGPLVPLALGVRRLVAVGDERQLPATVMDQVACKRGLGESLFERCVRDGVVRPGEGFVQLNEQRRMHPSIAAFPAQLFYGGELSNAPEMEKRQPIPGFVWPSRNSRVCFVNCQAYYEDQARALRSSKTNVEEAELLIQVLQRFLAANVPGEDIAVITGYAGQQDLLQRLVRGLGSASSGVKVDTVDGFQGTERDLILVSTVRSNAYGEVGFLRDPRRVNVMLTRARRGLVVFGDAATLQNEADTWQPWLKWIRDKGLLIAASEVLVTDEFVPEPPPPPPLYDPPGRAAENVAVVENPWTTYVCPDSGLPWRQHKITGEVEWCTT